MSGRRDPDAGPDCTIRDRGDWHFFGECEGCTSALLVTRSLDFVEGMHRLARIPDAALIAYRHLWAQRPAHLPEQFRAWLVPPTDPEVLGWLRAMRRHIAARGVERVAS